MKIGFVRRGYSSTGGAEAYLQRLAQGVEKEGHQAVLITSRNWPSHAWPNEFVIRSNADSPIRFAEDAERAASGCDMLFSLERIFSCDVFRAGDGVHRAWLERRAAFEPAWRGWIRALNPKHRELLRLERSVFSPEQTALVIANSRMVRDEIVAAYGYPRERIEIIPNGFDASPEREGLRESRRAELGLEPNAFTALFAGSGWERKGLSTALAAMRRMPAVKLIVAGKGNAARFHGAANTIFVGPRRDLQPDFAAADVFVLPTIYDPFSNACLEALASGLPVVTTTANGFSEIIVDGVHGSIVSPGDANALAHSLQFWSFEDRAKTARPICRELAARYSVAENTRRTLEVITRLAVRR